VQLIQLVRSSLFVIFYCMKNQLLFKIESKLKMNRKIRRISEYKPMESIIWHNVESDRAFILNTSKIMLKLQET